MPLTEREGNKLIDVIKDLMTPAKMPGPGEVVHVGVDMAKGKDKTVVMLPGEPRTMPAPFEAADEEALYQKFKARLLEELPVDPILLHVVMTRPEIRLSIERREVPIEGKSLKGRIAALIGAGFMDKAKRAAEINRELDRTGGQVNSGNLGRALADFRTDGLLTEDSDGWTKAPGVAVHVDRLVTP